MVKKQDSSDEAVSIIVGYAINLFIAAILVSTISLMTVDYVNGYEKDAVERDMQVISDSVAYEIEKIDLLYKQRDLDQLSYEIDVPLKPYNYEVQVKEKQVKVFHMGRSATTPINTSQSIENFTIAEGKEKTIEVKNNEIREK